MTSRYWWLDDIAQRSSKPCSNFYGRVSILRFLVNLLLHLSLTYLHVTGVYGKCNWRINTLLGVRGLIRRKRVQLSAWYTDFAARPCNTTLELLLHKQVTLQSEKIVIFSLSFIRRQKKATTVYWGVNAKSPYICYSMLLLIFIFVIVFNVYDLVSVVVTFSPSLCPRQASTTLPSAQSDMDGSDFWIKCSLLTTVF